jgi:hypothetical protein
MMFKTFLLAAAAVALFAFAPAQEKKAGTTKITGYLIDNVCAEASQGGEAEEAEGHMVSCALMEACMKSGYAVISEGKTYKLDEKGNKLALKLLRDTRVKQGLSVAVSGTLEGDTLHADTVTESR